jgi:hypothetical protein
MRRLRREVLCFSGGLAENSLFLSSREGMSLGGASQRLCPISLVIVVREADEMKIAHRFIGGINREAGSAVCETDGGWLSEDCQEFSRPLRGLDGLFVQRSQH